MVEVEILNRKGSKMFSINVKQTITIIELTQVFIKEAKENKVKIVSRDVNRIRFSFAKEGEKRPL